MQFTNILVNNESGICVITINRADKLNALNSQTITEIGKAVANAEQDGRISGIIITGAGPKAFVAGADISEFSSYTVNEGKELSAAGHKVFNSIEQCTKPVVAAVNGFALGGGCELAMSCHLRVASENAKFGQPEVKLGLIPGYGGTQRLISLIGRTKAVELLLTADMIDANEALRLGLVNYVTPSAELMNKAKELLIKIGKQSPKAVSGILRCTDAYFNKNVNGLEYEIDEFGRMFGTADFKEGVSAFLEKRQPEFEKAGTISN